jgi:general secretion pathway protein G
MRRRSRTTAGLYSGFTLIEMMITVVIVGVLASVVVPLAQLAVQRSKEQELRVGLRQIREAIDTYKRAVDDGRVARRTDETGFPRTLDSLVSGVEDIKDPGKKKIYFLRRLPRDPFSEPEQTAAESWGLRSYSSPPDAPSAGDDVYDVYSRSEGIGLNGLPYRAW